MLLSKWWARGKSKELYLAVNECLEPKQQEVVLKYTVQMVN